MASNASDPDRSSRPRINEGFLQTLATKNLNIQSVIGRGAFSEVYKATHTETKEILAIKCFKKEMTTKALYVSAAQEIAMMSVLNHPNIIPVKVYGISKTYVYIGTEYGCNESLQTYAESRNLCEPEIKNLMRQIISGLDYMHGIGVCHGDLKLQNIICFRIENGVPHIKICDFGLSEMKVKGAPFMHKSGSVLYLAPEIVLSKAVDLSCDLWSAGVIMYMLMFKSYMFSIRSHNIKDITEYMRAERRPKIPEIPKFTPSCIDFLKGLLEYNIRKRLQGERMRSHPFINITKQDFDVDGLLLTARNHINSALEHYDKKNYGDALVEANKSVLELKIKHNLTNDMVTRDQLKAKWRHYLTFVEQALESLLSKPEWDPQKGLISNQEMRAQLTSTPQLLTGFDIGIHGEMYLQEGNIKKATELFHQALQTILPLMKSEPSSPRKKALGLKLEKWIEYLQKYEEQSMESTANSSDTVTGAAGPSGLSNV